MPSLQPIPVEFAQSGIIPIHFKVPGHFLPLRTFVETAKQTQAIVDVFNRQIFGEQLHYSVLVLPPEPGSFLTRLGIFVTAGTILGGLGAALETDMGKGFVRGFTGNEPAYWTERAGVLLREKLLPDGNAPAITAPTPQDRAEQITSSMIMAEATKTFLQKDALELSRLGADTKRFRDAYEARNLFYKSCYENPQLSALGFEEDEEFPIQRSDFSRLQVTLPPREDQDEGPWRVTIEMLNVTSPVWDRDDKQRQWKGKDADGHDRYFKIEDENFWELVKDQRLDPHIIDTIKVQWAFHENKVRPKDARVLRVLEYNGERLAEPLDENALNALLGPYEFGGSDPNQPGLF